MSQLGPQRGREKWRGKPDILPIVSSAPRLFSHLFFVFFFFVFFFVFFFFFFSFSFSFSFPSSFSWHCSSSRALSAREAGFDQPKVAQMLLHVRFTPATQH
jgi:hypothetical protein